MSKQNRHLYEGMYILSATLSEDARKKSVEKIINGITSREGEIHKTFEQGRKKLAYEINKRREGYYYLFYFSVPAKAISELWKEYHLNEDLLRFLNIRVEIVPEKIEFKPLPQE